MNYDLDWTPAAHAQLADLWVDRVAHRSEITEAAARIDQFLASDPAKWGTPLSEGLFAINVRPLRADFEILDKRVIVVALRWLIGSN